MNIKVLLVEDDDTMRSLLKTLLELEGFVITTASYEISDELLSAIKIQTPDVLLIDVHLQGVNGLDLLREIRKDELNSHLFIIMTSGMDLRDQCLKAGADGFLLKPYMPDELINQIKSISISKKN